MLLGKNYVKCVVDCEINLSGGINTIVIKPNLGVIQTIIGFDISIDKIDVSNFPFSSNFIQ